MQKARTDAPSCTRRSVTWLPMKPSAPVTSTVRPFSDVSDIDPPCDLQLVALPHVDPVLLDLEGGHALVARQAVVEQRGDRKLLVARHPGHDLGIEDIDARVRHHGEPRLLFETQNPLVL